MEFSLSEPEKRESFETLVVGLVRVLILNVNPNSDCVTRHIRSRTARTTTIWFGLFAARFIEPGVVTGVDSSFPWSKRYVACCEENQARGNL